MSDSVDHDRVSILASLYNKTVLGVPYLALAVVLAFVLFFGYHIKDFKFDASSEAVILENDPDLRYYNTTRELFGSDDYVVIAFTPHDDLFSEAILNSLTEMSNDLLDLDRVASVLSILTVPLFHSRKGDRPNSTFLELTGPQGYQTLAMETCEHELARKELTESPLYKDYLISSDGKTTAIQVNFIEAEQDYLDLYNRRAHLRDKRTEGTISDEERRELAEIERKYVERHTEKSVERSEDIVAVREIVKKYESLGSLHLGGVPMVIADIITYVESDIVNLGLGVLVMVLIVLSLIFRKIKWVVLPALTCILTVLLLIGYLGYAHWRGTIVTSNFPSLLMVITLAMTVHIVVRYREIYAGNPDLSNRELIFRTVRAVATPCLYTSLTTIVGFGSLIVSRMRPVIDFGLIMALGLCVAYMLCFVFFPSALMFFPKGKVPPKKLAELTRSPVAVFATFTERHGKLIALCAVGLFVVSAIGITRLKVENRFIDYFRASTAIYQGMTVIDQRLGGTTPLEVVLTAPLALMEAGDAKDYWLEDDNRARLRKAHEWLDSLPETGKVISPDTMIRMLERINTGRDGKRKPVSKTLLQVALAAMPDEISEPVIGPYMTPDRDQVRIAMRVRESSRDLVRKDLKEKLDAYFADNPDFEEGTVHITGVFVLYNNLLQSLFNSQVKTIGVVFLAIWLMFLVLFRSFVLATIAIIPNILPVVVVLGTLGWSDIPLDMMTIMIAAITLGIAVDHATHYIYRFKVEFPKDRDYVAAMHRCHNSVGRAVFYSSVAIIAGFSFLTISNFIPSVYFGLFTSLAMVVAFAAAVTLLPLLLITWKPLGPEERADSV